MDLLRIYKDIRFDEVITSYGNMSVVENVLSYDIKEDIVIIGRANEEVKLINDHELLAIKTSACTKEWKDKSKLPVVCKKRCSIKDKCSNPVYKQYEAKWIEAKELSKDDFILYPRVKDKSKK